MAKETKAGRLRSDGKVVYRTATFERSGIDVGKRLVPIAFSSETPVVRWYGMEVLDHSPGAADLSRMLDGAAVLVEHDPSDPVGVVETASIDPDKFGRALLRFGNSTRAQEVFQDVVDGIRTKISAGYIVHDLPDKPERLMEDGTPVFRIKRWEPVEVSIVSVPADAAVGVNRSAADGTDDAPPAPETVNEKTEDVEKREGADGDDPNTTTTTTGEIKMDENKNVPTAEEVVRAERDRIAEIDAVAARFVGKVPKIQEIRAAAVKGGYSVERFKGEIADNLPDGQPLENLEVGLTDKQTRDYSIANAVRSLLPGADPKIGTFEREVSDEIAKRVGKAPAGIYVPMEVQKRAVLVAGTANLGGDIVATNLEPQNFIELLRNKMIALRLGVKVRSGLVGNVAIPKLAGSASAYWVTEDAALTASNPTFGQLTLTPKTVGAYTDLGRQLLLQSTPTVDGIVTDDLTTILAQAIDTAILQGSGSAGQPTGIVNTAGLASTSNASMDWTKTVAHETNVNTANADLASCAFVTTPAGLGILKTREKSSGTGIFLCEENRLNGYPVWSTGNLPSANLLFGDFGQTILGEWGTLDLTVDPFKNSDKGTVRIIVFQSVDVAVRQIGAFSLGTSLS